MKKITLFFNTLLATILITSAAQAVDFLAYVTVNNKTPWDLNIWWKNHHKRYNAENAFTLLKGENETFFLHKAAMSGPLHVTKAGLKPSRTYTVFSTPKDAYFLPINKKGAVYRALDLEPALVGRGLRIRQSFPDFYIEFAGLELWKDPYLKMKERQKKVTVEE
ncbi:hypothetical protein KAH94_04560 [bacterium]|nr:hypothetical protein [bacterium]